MNIQTAENRGALHLQRAELCITNWEFDVAASTDRSRHLTDAERHALKHQIARQVSHAEYEACRTLSLCLAACKIALSMEKDTGGEKDDHGEDFFHVKSLKTAIAEAKKAGYE